MSDRDVIERVERAVSYVEIVELLAQYATIIDNREWDALDRVFTPNVRFDVTSIGSGVLSGLGHVKSHMANHARHPAAHLILNVVADISPDRASVSSRLLALQGDGRVFMGEYRDVFIRTQEGWRIDSRVYSRLQQPSDPALATQS